MKLYVWILSGLLSLLIMTSQAQQITATAPDNSPSSAKASLVLDYNSDFESYYENELQRITRIEDLTLKNLSEDHSSPFIGRIRSFRSLNLQSVASTSGYKTLSSINGSASIGSLRFQTVHLRQIPASLSDIEIHNVCIDDCNGMRTSELIFILSHNKHINRLRINNSQLVRFPNKIGDFSKLNSLDLTGNQLNEISPGILQLKSLDTLLLSGNFIPGAAEELAKLAEMNIKYLEIDPLTEQNMIHLRSLLKNTEIVIVDERNQKVKTKSLTYGEIKATKDGVEALSSAYAIYPILLQNRIATFAFDSTGFEERFYSKEYQSRYGTAIGSVSDGSFKLHRHQEQIRNRISFNLFPHERFLQSKKGKSSDQVYKAYPELSAFRNMNWVLDDTISKKFFYRNVRYMRFHDVRVLYNSSLNNFTLVLKSDTGWFSVRAFPVMRNKNKSLEDSQSKYPDLYANYVKRLTKRGSNFNKRLAKNKRKVLAARRNYERMVWDQLRDNYMCADERKMSRKEWMKYYFDVINHEEEALQNASVNLDLLQRALQVKGYVPEPPLQVGVNTADIRSVDCTLTDLQSNNLPVQSIVLINKTLMTYKVQYVNLGQLSHTLLMYDNCDYAITGILVDWSVSLTPSDVVEQALEVEENTIFRSQLLPAGLISIGQTLETLEL